MTLKPLINFEDFEKLDIRIGKIISVEDHPDADKLYVLKVDFGEKIGTRTICAGLRQLIPKEKLEGKKCPFIINLAPRTLRGVESQGMILAAGNKEENKFTILTPSEDIEEGSRVS